MESLWPGHRIKIKAVQLLRPLNKLSLIPAQRGPQIQNIDALKICKLKLKPSTLMEIDWKHMHTPKSLSRHIIQVRALNTCSVTISFPQTLFFLGSHLSECTKAPLSEEPKVSPAHKRLNTLNKLNLCLQFVIMMFLFSPFLPRVTLRMWREWRHKRKKAAKDVGWWRWWSWAWHVYT